MERVSEDRVAGRPEGFPAPPLPLRASASMDILSLRVEGADAVFAREGTEDRPPLVFLHGWGASHRFWKWQFGAFSGRFRCFAPDFPGFGLSDKPDRDYSVQALSRWVGSFLDALGLRKATLAGHSMGGMIALLFALDHPERVERLAVANPVVRGPAAFPGEVRFLMLPGVRRLAFGLAHGAGFRRWIARNFSLVQRLDPELAGDIVRGTFRAMVDSYRSLLRTDLVPRLGGLSVPALAVGTDQDRLVDPGQYLLIPTAKKVLIPKTGHIPLLERPEEFNRALDEFLRLPSAGGVI
jgi:pimeloyl-ACP methyl ester carboxylesterase